MKVISLDEARKLVRDSFVDPEDAPELELQDEHDVFVDVDDQLIWANTLDELADEWDPVDGCWMEYDGADEDFWNNLKKVMGT